MVTAVTSFGRSGLYDWLIQRVTAVIMGAYTIFLAVYILAHPELSFVEWQGLFGHLWMRVFSLLTLISIAVHAWIGMWSVLTDYVTIRLMGPKATFLRILAQMLMGLVTVTYVIWGIEILWGL